MKEEIDSRDAVFGMMFLATHETAYSIFAKLNRNWFDLVHHQRLYDFAAMVFAESKSFDLMSAAKFFHENKFFTKHFTVAHLSAMTTNVGYADLIVADSIIGDVIFKFELLQASKLHQELGRITLGGSFSVSDALSCSQRFIDTIDSEKVSVIEEKGNDEIIEEILEDHDRASTGVMPGINLGYKSLSEIIIEPVDLAVIAARPSMGKTAFLVSVIRNMIFDLGYNVVLFSLEMSKQQIMRRLIANITGISANAIKTGKCTPEQKAVIRSLMQREELKNLTIYEGAHKPIDVIRKSARLHSVKAIDAVLVDYLQKMQKENQKHSDFEHVSNCSNQLKNLAQNMKIPVIALSQLSRSNEQRGGDKRPMLSDLRSSGEIEQDASLVAFLHRLEYYGIMENEHGESTRGMGEVIIAKYREGALGIHEMEIDPNTIRWQDKQQNTVLSFDKINNSFQPNLGFDNQKTETPF